MSVALQQRFRGVIASVRNGEGYGFISIQSCLQANGDSHELPTSENIFIHQDECSEDLKVGMALAFEVVPDPKRENCYRAQSATRWVEGEIVDSSGVPGFGLTNVTGGALVVRREQKHPWHFKAKKVDEDKVAKVVENDPMPSVPRVETELSPEELRQRMRMFMAALYPTMFNFGTDFDVLEANDEQLDAEVAQARADLVEFEMTDAVAKLDAEVKGFKDIRGVMKTMHDDGLVRPDTFIPMRNLPDMFMACPVWYGFVESEKREGVAATWENSDPRVSESTQWFVEQFPNDRWAHTFQMFNRRVRDIRSYSGDIIPPQITRRMKQALTVFDYVVIATPYHDVAGMDWQDLEWIRQIDPYVLGFKKGLPVFFVLGRFSDSGTFPLFNEMVADTMDFLETNKQKLKGFNAGNSPYWYCPDTHKSGPDCFRGDQLGDHLITHVNKMQQAFEAGHLFSWLRGDWSPGMETAIARQ